MSNSGLDTSWNLILTDDPFGSDMVDVSPVTRKWLDVPYDDKSPSQVLDIYLPEEGEGPFPAYIFVHGGMFLLGDKQDMQFMLAIDGVNRGYAVISLEYRRALETKAPAALYDVKAALRFLRAHAAEYRLDPERFALGGDSAGAYYAVFTPVSTMLGNFFTAKYASVKAIEYIVLGITMVTNMITEFLFDKFVVFRNSENTAEPKEK